MSDDTEDDLGMADFEDDAMDEFEDAEQFGGGSLRDNPLFKMGIIAAAFVAVVGGIMLFGGKEDTALTSRIRGKLLPSHVKIDAGVSGLTLDSVLLCEQIRVIDKRRVRRVLGHLEKESLDEVAVAIRTILGV